MTEIQSLFYVAYVRHTTSNTLETSVEQKMLSPSAVSTPKLKLLLILVHFLVYSGLESTWEMIFMFGLLSDLTQAHVG